MQPRSTPYSAAKALSMAAMLPLLATPLASHADKAMDACIKAFIGTTLPLEQPVRIVKTAGAPQLAAQTQQIDLTAAVSRTGERIATATCIVDRSGAVIALHGSPGKKRLVGAMQPTAAG